MSIYGFKRAAPLLLCLAALLPPAAAAAASWPQQQADATSADQTSGLLSGLPASSVTVLLFEWSWADVAQECEEFLGPAGYKAVQVSPPQEDVPEDAWWSRYQPVSYKLVSRSGSAAEFADMVRRCTAVGVEVVVDAVLNHMANRQGGGRGRAGTPIGPGCRRFPEMYSACADFHHYDADCCNNCQVDSDTDLWRIQNCDLGLPDLATGSPYVQQQLAAYLRSLADLNVTGIRVDAAKHIPAADLAAIARQAGRPLWFNLEVNIPAWAPCAVDLRDYCPLGRVWEFKLPALVSAAFKPADRRLDLLAQANHDLLVSGSSRQGAVTYLDGQLYPLALTFLLAHPYGQPVVLSSLNIAGQLGPSGDYSGAPVDPATGRLLPVHGPGGELNCGAGKPYLCEHRWPAVSGMLAWRRVAGDTPLSLLQTLSSNAALALARGTDGRSRAFVLINAAWRPGGQLRARLQTGLPPGAYCHVLQPDGCTSPVVVGPEGTADFDVPLLSAVALHIEALAPAAQAEVV
ncbi:hypothetical protein ABPG77_005147 [Micractinium sp. CCAP 211/92]